MWEDPIVAEVREKRQRLAEDWGQSFEKILDHAIQAQGSFKNRSAERKPIDLPDERTLNAALDLSRNAA